MSQTGRLSQILIVDDEPNVRLVFRTALESRGYALAEAEDGATALERLAAAPADLVLLDLQMPGIGGMEVLRRLRDAGNDAPVVIVTAHGSIPDAVAAMKLGAIDFLTKPLNPEQLRRVVAEVIKRQSARAPEHALDQEPDVTLSPARPRPGSSTVVTLAPAAVDLTAIKRALNHRQFDRALDELEEVLQRVPDSAEAHTLMGVLRESLGQAHAAYHAYRLALQADPHFGPARDNMKRYCAQFGLDARNPSINPAAK
jgi:DNA-binding response OmpR family regulator